jgi:hypothetical protein
MHPPALAPAVPPSPSQGNAIAANPLSWHQMIVSALVVGLTIWVVEQNFGQKPAFILATVILLGVTFYYKGFAAELQSIVSGKA